MSNFGFYIGKSMPQNIILSKTKMSRTMQRPTALNIDWIFTERNVVVTLVQNIKQIVVSINYVAGELFYNLGAKRDN